MQKLFVLAGVLVCSLQVWAQDYSKAEVFGGYQYTRLSSDISPVAGANGWDGAITVNFNNVIGITGDFNGAYQHVSGSYVGTSGSYPGHFFSYTAGPTFSFNSGGKVRPFLHFLFGGARVSSSASANGLTVSASANGFTEMAGGGLDMKLSKSISFRLVQADWVFYHFGSLGSLGSTNSYGNAKIATGVVFHF